MLKPSEQCAPAVHITAGGSTDPHPVYDVEPTGVSCSTTPLQLHSTKRGKQTFSLRDMSLDDKLARMKTNSMPGLPVQPSFLGSRSTNVLQGQMVSKVNEICDLYVMFDAGLNSARFRSINENKVGQQCVNSGQFIHVVACIRRQDGGRVTAFVEMSAMATGFSSLCAPLHQKSRCASEEASCPLEA